MDKTKIGIAVVVWGLIVTVDLLHGFFGILSVIGYVILAGLIWILLTAGDGRKITGKPKYVPVRLPQSMYWILFHGTKPISSAARIIQEGFRPGIDGAFGVGLYLSAYFDDAVVHAGQFGAIFKLYIRNNTPWNYYDNIPGFDNESKNRWCRENGLSFVYIPQYKWFVVMGLAGVPLTIPGLAKVEVLDFHGNPINIQ